MRRVSLRNISSHKLRLALTVLAVVLGTAFISGAFMFTKALSNTFDSAVSTSFDGVDVMIAPGGDMKSIPMEDVDRLRSDPKFGAVNVMHNTTVALGNAEGEAIQAGGTSTIHVWYPGGEKVGAEEPIVAGKAPETADQVVVNQSATDTFGLKEGDKLIAVDRKARNKLTVTGFFDTDAPTQSSKVLSLGMSERGYLERYTGGKGVPQLVVSAAGDQSPAELLSYVRSTYPQFESREGRELAEELSKTVSQALKFVNYFLVAFGLIGLLVGTFLIANTFSMIVAQRTKEFALLRALGASRRQITVSVVFEAVVVGLLGSAVGVVAGMGLVAAIKAVLEAMGNELPGSGLGLSVPAVLVPIVLGTVVTVVSAWAPARRAGQVQPVEAMRANESSTATPLVARTVVGSIAIAAGVAAAAMGAAAQDQETTPRAVLVGFGLVLVIVGFFLAGPALSIPIVPTLGRIIGAPFRAIGRLAATNSRRNPRRVATTAFALTLGIALVTAIGMLGHTLKASLADSYQNNIKADFILSGPTGQQFPLPGETTQRVEKLDSIEKTGQVYMAPVLIDGAPAQQGSPVGEVVEGDLADTLPITVNDEPGANTQAARDVTGVQGFFAEERVAQARDWKVGQNYPVSGPDGSTVDVPLLATFSGAGHMVMPVLVTKAAADHVVRPGAMQFLQLAVVKKDGVDAEKLRGELEAAVKDLLVVQVMDAKDMADELGGAVDSLLNILYGMLGLAVVIAILGIVNTLTLNVIERRREIGMLRAVGTQRGQVRQMIILESVAIAVFGALAGIAIGLGLGWAFLRVLAGEGLDTIAVPWALIVWMLVGSAVVGVLSALWPASRAARTAPLDAIAED